MIISDLLPLTDDQKEYVEIGKKMDAYRLRGIELRKRLKVDCQHPMTTRYQFEHDNGYGVQTRRLGQRCMFCEAIKKWDRWVRDGQYV